MGSAGHVHEDKLGSFGENTPRRPALALNVRDISIGHGGKPSETFKRAVAIQTADVLPYMP